MRDERLIRIHASSSRSFAERPFEACEHKGIGHPDTLTDGTCEAAAVALAQAYRATYGRVLHFNLDKGLLVAGRSAPRFGGGAITEPIKLIVCGRAANPEGSPRCSPAPSATGSRAESAPARRYAPSGPTYTLV